MRMAHVIPCVIMQHISMESVDHDDDEGEGGSSSPIRLISSHVHDADGLAPAGLRFNAPTMQVGSRAPSVHLLIGDNASVRSETPSVRHVPASPPPPPLSVMWSLPRPDSARRAPSLPDYEQDTRL